MRTDSGNRVEENIGLVHLCAKRFMGRGLEYDDIFQAGCVGLIKAADNFDSEKGFKFSTYAVPVILGEMKGLFREGGAVKVSRSVRELARKVHQQADSMREETGVMPTVSEIAEKLGISTEKAAMALGASVTPISLTGGEESGEIQIPVEAPEEQMTERMTLYQILETLEEKDRLLLKYRYFQNKTQQETANLLDMTQVQVSRKEKKLLIYMRTLL
ncbi:sigma-70 family RNA polymerase sigma factor [Scatolibacter rhodanostii]|uniref:sigma-70 family RNA polymerase sigma factor n=1 Tax=Scatolibacter rhodanostii TaxID=2014781 RepID=UPI000C08CDAC|nr:sigma-70 family RNA polymerase sigma factor [Scatolibacter rhodanostii]